MLSFVKLSVMIPPFVMLSVIMLTFDMLSAVMLSIVVLSCLSAKTFSATTIGGYQLKI
jgi:hypothetical protein